MILADRLDARSVRSPSDVERDAAYADVRVFARHCRIADAHGRDVAFADVGWPWQFALLWLWSTTRLSVVLKARQLGVSWLAAMFALWTAIAKPGQAVLLISRGQNDAEKLLAKVAYLYERLPVWKPKAIVNARTISFANGSDIEAMPATEDAGRGRTANLVVLDEHAHQPFARRILAAVLPAASAGRILSISSGNGTGALHSKLFLDAKDGQPLLVTNLGDGTPLPLRITRTVGPNGWRAMFLPYDAHPDHDAAWREEERRTMASLSDAMFTQEHPRDDTEAIVAIGSPIFDAERLAEQEIRTGIPIPGIAGAIQFAPPVAGIVYAIGADPAEGLIDSDWSSATVLCIDKVVDGFQAEQVATLRGRFPPEVFAAKLDALARHYGSLPTPRLRTPVLLCWERNNHGHAVRVALVPLYGHSAPYRVFHAKDRQLGWLQTAETRAIIVDGLASAMRTDALVLHDAITIEQFGMFHENERGRAEAAEGAHDDDVIATGIAWQMRWNVFPIVLDVIRPAPQP